MDFSFEELKRNHQSLAKRLLRPTVSSRDWEAFLNEVLPYDDGVAGNRLAYKYKKMIQDRCSSCVAFEDFRNFFQQYVTFWNSEALTRVLSANGHFFTSNFGNVFKEAYQLFEAIHRKSELEANTVAFPEGKEGLSAAFGDGDESEEEGGSSPEEEMACAEASGESEAPAGAIRRRRTRDEGGRAALPYGEYLEKIPPRLIRELWKKNLLDALCLLLRGRLSLAEEYVGNLLQCRGDAVRQRYGRIFEKWRHDYAHPLYRADGRQQTEELDRWLSFQACLTFATQGEEEDEPGAYRCHWHLPWKCVPTAERFLIVECRKANGELLAGEAQLHFGSLCIPVSDGVAEISVADWQEAISSRREGCLALDVGGETHELFPQMTNGLPPCRMVDMEVIRRWKGRKADAGELKRFLVDFGKELAWLLNDKLDYARYGAPGDVRHIHLQAKPYEAWVLLGRDGMADADGEENAGGMLPAAGVLLPLEWRYGSTASSLLPGGMLRLEKVAREQCREEKWADRTSPIRMAREVLRGHQEEGWSLHPSYRIFHDNVDFSQGGLCGIEERDVSSAFLTLLVALVYAKNDGYCVGEGLFASASCAEGGHAYAPVGSLERKMQVAGEYGAARFYLCQAQLQKAWGLLAGIRQMLQQELSLRAIPEGDVWKGAEATAYDFLAALADDGHNHLHHQPEAKYKMQRRELLRSLAAAANRHWREGCEDAQAFVHLCAKPGMGKSVLMTDLQGKLQGNHVVAGFACIAGERNGCANFIRSVAWQLSSRLPQFAILLSAYLQKCEMPEEMSLPEARQWYRALVVEPLRKLKLPQNTRLYLLVDGLDEDDSGLLLELLVDKELALPENVALVASSRPLPGLCQRLRRRFGNGVVVDLDSEEYHEECHRALERYIIYRFYSSEHKSDTWQFAEQGGDAFIRAIVSKDDSFLYAKAVLDGIEERQYSFERLEEELPGGLYEHYHTSFKARFAGGRYEEVRPLLKLLAGGRIKISDAEGALRQAGVEASVWKLMEELRGYCVFYGEDEIGLSDATLREWLLDRRANLEFGI